MKMRTLYLGTACVFLNGLAVWSAFQGPDWLTSTLTLLILLTILGLVANLLLHRSDWGFRGAALLIVGIYLLFNAYQVWRFFKHAD
jgi:hypothetical protein